MFRIDRMTVDDIAEVGKVERRCFSNPWPASAYRRELRFPEQNYYVVLRATDDEAKNSATASDSPRRALSRLVHPFTRKSADEPMTLIAGFAGMWVMYDEAHVTTIGTDPNFRGMGFGELLLAAMFDEAIQRGATVLTLEVRVTNRIAQSLYEKYGMSVQGIRARYYTDNGEDAYIMWSKSLRDPAYLAELDALRAAIVSRLESQLIESPEFPFVHTPRMSDVAQ